MAYSEVVRNEATHYFPLGAAPSGNFVYTNDAPAKGGTLPRSYFPQQGPPLTHRYRPSMRLANTTGTGGTTPSQVYAGLADGAPNITGTPWALECVFRPRIIAGTAIGLIWRVNEGTIGGGYWLQMLNNGAVQVGCRPISQAYQFTATPTSALVAGRRYHIVAGYDGSSFAIYLNGTLATAPVAVTAENATPAPNNSNLRIGASNVASTGLDGDIDDVAIYDGSFPDVMAHYRLLPGVPSKLSTPSLVL